MKSRLQILALALALGGASARRDDDPELAAQHGARGAAAVGSVASAGPGVEITSYSAVATPLHVKTW